VQSDRRVNCARIEVTPRWIQASPLELGVKIASNGKLSVVAVIAQAPVPSVFFTNMSEKVVPDAELETVLT